MDEQPTQSVNNPPIGFKPREFLLGVGVAVVIVMAVAASRWFVRAAARDGADRCRINLFQLNGAKAHWVSNHNEVPSWADLVAPKGTPFAGMPHCPRGGTYTIGPVGQPPRCSISEHTLTQ